MDLRPSIVGLCENFQHLQNASVPEALRKITNDPPFICYYCLHIDLSMKTVDEEAAHFYKSFHNHLQSHFKLFIQILYTQSIPGNPRRR